MDSRPLALRLAHKAALLVNVVGTGVLLGLLQFGALFTLESYLASTAMVYLLATTTWLAGSAVGLALPGRGLEPLWLFNGIAAYALLRHFATRHPFEMGLLPPLLLAVLVMGAYAGRFFRCRAGAFRKVKWLLFLENTGFVVGIVATVPALYLAGEGALVTAPLLAAAVVLATLLLLGALAPAPPASPAQG